MSVNFNQQRELNINLDILDNIRTAIVIINRQYDYVYSNVAADDLLGSAKLLKKLISFRAKILALNHILMTFTKMSNQ